MPDATAIADHVVANHRGTVAAVLAAADEAARDIDAPASRDAVVAAMDDALGEGVRADLVALLRGAVDAAGGELQAEPVPAPPYVVVTARGPLARATLSDARLVVLVRAFERSGDGYVRASAGPDSAVEVELRRRP